MKLTAQQKAKYFALYYGQKVWFIDETRCATIDAYLLQRINDGHFLQLRSIESLTDEEMNVLRKLEGHKFWTQQYKIKVMERYNFYSGDPKLINWLSYDYLRSIGIALPFHDGTRIITLHELIDEKVIKVI